MANVLGIIKQPITHEWETPPDFFAALDREFAFTLDAAASSDNAKCLIYYDNFGLDLPWEGIVWCNPPYGTKIGKWVAKGYREAQKGSTVVMLIPSRTDTAWWHDYCMKAAEIRLVRGRLRFSGATINAPFPSAVIVFRPGDYTPVFSAIERNGETV
jgi:phage N-6-adenine-methyltransferase